MTGVYSGFAPDAFTTGHRDLIVALAARYRLPAVYPLRVFAASGGLISDGGDPIDIFRRAASYVDRILKGTRPGDLPVQAPTKFELVINLKTAKALGLTVPITLLGRAESGTSAGPLAQSLRLVAPCFGRSQWRGSRSTATRDRGSELSVGSGIVPRDAPRH